MVCVVEEPITGKEITKSKALGQPEGPSNLTESQGVKEVFSTIDPYKFEFCRVYDENFQSKREKIYSGVYRPLVKEAYTYGKNSTVVMFGPS